MPSPPFIKRFLLAEIKDEIVRENFGRLIDLLKGLPIVTSQMKFFEYTFTSAVTNLQIRHNLGFRPLDLIQSSVVGGATVTWNYDRFTNDFLDVTTSGSCVVRGFVGRYDPEVKF